MYDLTQWRESQTPRGGEVLGAEGAEAPVRYYRPSQPLCPPPLGGPVPTAQTRWNSSPREVRERPGSARTRSKRQKCVCVPPVGFLGSNCQFRVFGIATRGKHLLGGLFPSLVGLRILMYLMVKEAFTTGSDSKGLPVVTAKREITRRQE